MSCPYPSLVLMFSLNVQSAIRVEMLTVLERHTCCEQIERHDNLVMKCFASTDLRQVLCQH